MQSVLESWEHADPNILPLPHVRHVLHFVGVFLKCVVGGQLHAVFASLTCPLSHAKQAVTLPVVDHVFPTHAKQVKVASGARQVMVVDDITFPAKSPGDTNVFGPTNVQTLPVLFGANQCLFARTVHPSSTEI